MSCYIRGAKVRGLFEVTKFGGLFLAISRNFSQIFANLTADFRR